MSRNFELLQKLGKELDMFDPAPEKQVVAAVEQSEAELAPARPPQFDLDPRQRDEITKLVQRVFLAAGPEGSRVVTFCGIEAGGGSSWICARAAEMLAAQVAGTVCAVDANFPEPGLHQHFGLECGDGLTNALQFSDPIRKYVHPTASRNLWLLSCGGEAREWQSLLGSDRMRARLAELRADFDYVLIDAPALNPSNDVVALGHASEGVVLVLKANASRREVARKAVKDLENASVRVLGAVLNNRTFPIPENIYKKL
ncbi:MAG: CpsD/CapB family tyrosine-protein kinase [Candidatus Sulfotelmatobacter sp.]